MNCQLCGKNMGLFETTYKLNVSDSRFKALRDLNVCLKCSDAVVRTCEAIELGYMTNAFYGLYSDEIKPHLVEIAAKQKDDAVRDALVNFLQEADVMSEDVCSDKKEADERERKRLEEERLRREKAELERKRQFEANVARRRNNLKMQGFEKAYEYKVISMIDKFGRTDTASMELTLNDLALDGWRVKSVVCNELGKNELSVMGFGVNSTADEVVIILEREYFLL